MLHKRPNLLQTCPRWFCFFLFGLIIYLSLFFLIPVNLFTADIGRHIINGREIISALPHRSLVFDINYYSYTQPDYPFINHHWFYGVISYGLYHLIGFVGLQLVNVFLKVLAVIIMLFGLVWLTTQKQRFLALVLASFVGLPFVTYRTEIRPETVSFLFSALVYLLLLGFLKRKLTSRLFFAFLTLVTLVWVNTHIFWFFMPVIISTFWLTTLIKKDWFVAKRLSLALGLVGLVGLINPFGYRLLVYPLMIMRGYGYQIAENQTVWFMLKRFGWPICYYFLIIGGVLLLVLLADVIWRKFKINSYDWLLVVVFYLASFKLNRLIPFFGLFLLTVMFKVALALVKVVIEDKDFVALLSSKLYIVPLISTIGFFSLLAAFASGLWMPPLTKLHLGLLPNSFGLAKFIKEADIKGPVFNNYDIGGYLIFNLFPKEKVYVDNRPEAYAADFLQQKYVKPQEDESTWHQLEKEYKFRTIIFYRLDQTPWAQPFLIKRIKDKSWVPIYVDSYSIVIIKKTKETETIIKQFALPPTLFKFD